MLYVECPKFSAPILASPPPWWYVCMGGLKGDIRGAMYARPPTISQLTRIFTFHIHLHRISRDRLRPRKSSGNHHYPHFPLPTTNYQRRSKCLLELPYSSCRPTWLKSLQMLSFIAICRPDGDEYRPVSREQAPGITAQLVDPCRSSLLERSHPNTLYGGESTRWIIQSYRWRWNSCQWTFFLLLFSHNKKANNWSFYKRCYHWTYLGKGCRNSIKTSGQNVWRWQKSFVGPGQTSFPLGGHSPTPTYLYPVKN